MLERWVSPDPDQLAPHLYRSGLHRGGLRSENLRPRASFLARFRPSSVKRKAQDARHRGGPTRTRLSPIDRRAVRIANFQADARQNDALHIGNDGEAQRRPEGQAVRASAHARRDHVRFSRWRYHAAMWPGLSWRPARLRYRVSAGFRCRRFHHAKIRCGGGAAPHRNGPRYPLPYGGDDVPAPVGIAQGDPRVIRSILPAARHPWSRPHTARCEKADDRMARADPRGILRRHGSERQYHDFIGRMAAQTRQRRANSRGFGCADPRRGRRRMSAPRSWANPLSQHRRREHTILQGFREERRGFLG